MFTVIKSKRRSASKQGCFKGVRTRPRSFDRSAARAPVPQGTAGHGCDSTARLAEDREIF